MNRFEKWLVKRILEKEFIQGYDHLDKLRDIYALIREVWIEEFNEDSSITTDHILRFEFEQTQEIPYLKTIP